VGFFGKAVVFGAAIQAGGWFLALALIGVLTSVLAIFYYFRIIVQMYMSTAPTLEEGKASRLVGKPALSLSFVLLLAVVGTLGLSLLAGVSLDWAKDAANSIVGLVQTH
jgi:NADH-quinone oxidoreductase subunit N